MQRMMSIAKNNVTFFFQEYAQNFYSFLMVDVGSGIIMSFTDIDR